MKEALLDFLRCPESGQSLKLLAAQVRDGVIESGELATVDLKQRYPIKGYVPRFVSADNYATNFGFQWNKFRETQLDSRSGVGISAERFYRTTGWDRSSLKGKRVLDAGCGAGRFAEVALESGADVVAIDFSTAAEACRANFPLNRPLEVLQADIYRLPFVPESFDFVYCMGVLQHTPDVKKAFLSLTRMVKPGGSLAVDVYRKQFKNLLWPKYWLRPITKAMPQQKLFRIIQKAVPSLLRVSEGIRRVPLLGKHLRFLIPVANYYGNYPLSPKLQEEWSILDTFDMFGPTHDYPQTEETLTRWFAEAGFERIDVRRSGFNIGRGAKPTSIRP